MTYKIKRINEDKVNAILKALLEGPKTKYTLERKDRIASGGTIYNYCKILLERNLIIIGKTEAFQRTGMKKKYYQITFPGLLHLIKSNVFSVEEGRRIRLQAEVEFPLEGEENSHLNVQGEDYKKNMRILLEVLEDVAPDLFYEYLISIGFENELIPLIVHLNFAAIWTRQRLEKIKDKRIESLHNKIIALGKDRSWRKFVAQNRKALLGLVE